MKLKLPSLTSVFVLCGAMLGVAVHASENNTTDTVTPDQTKPNFVWLVSEDNSQHYLAHFFAGGAQTPAIAQLAESGITFSRAYSNAPVCSVARTTLQTGIYAPKIGVQYHRAYKPMPMPNGVKYVHEWLKEAGYFVTNNSKTDYNFATNGRRTWDYSSKKASWRQRSDKSQPFFHMQTFFVSHESRLHFSSTEMAEQLEGVNLADASLPPYMPDTDLFRFTQLYYQSLIEKADQQVNDVLLQLEEDGELENTFVFYFSDHGGVLPRGKGYLYESGIHVPLVVRVPAKYRHLVPEYVQKTSDGVVEFVDFAPTLLALAGIEKPPVMDGESFLGTTASIDSTPTTFSYADRFDEKYDLVRSITQGDYHYIRSFQPYLPDGLHNRYRYKMLAYQQWRDMYHNNELTPEQAQFFEPKPVEMLFNVAQDPHEVVNLAADPEYRETLLNMRDQLTRTMAALPDLGLLPESYVFEQDIADPLTFGQTHHAQLQDLLDIAQWQLSTYATTKADLTRVLSESNPLATYWALLVLMSYDAIDTDMLKLVSSHARRGPDYVRIKAAEVLGKLGQVNPQPLLTDIVNKSSNPVAVTEALNAVVYFDENSAYSAQRKQLNPSVDGRGISARMAFLTSSSFVKH